MDWLLGLFGAACGFLGVYLAIRMWSSIVSRRRR
jgi:hypothetical protein